MATLSFKELGKKKTAAIISQMSLSPLEKKAALWEIKAHPLEGVDGISENGTPF